MTGPGPENERWQHSVPLDRKYWADNPGYLSTIPPRISKYAQTSDDALIQAHIDIVGKENIGVIDALLSPVGNFASVSMAEATPETVALVAYASEVPTLCDDLDFFESDQLSVESISSVLPPYYQHLDMKREGPVWKARGKEALSKIFVKFLEVDPALGKELIHQFTAWRASENTIKKRFHEYKTLEEYKIDRVEDSGWPYVILCMKLGHNIQLKPKRKKLQPIMYFAR